MNCRPSVVVSIFAVSLALSSSNANAAPSAQEIVNRMIEADPMGYGGAEANLVMVLIDKKGKKRTRKLTAMSRNEKKIRRSFVRFYQPPDLAGTAFLGINDHGKRIQHLHLPALKKTRRISGSNRNGRFVGSDYTFADMDYTDIENATVKRGPDETVAGQSCYVITAKPTSKDSPYGRAVLAISKKMLLPLRIQYFDKKGKELKKLSVQKIKKVDSKWVITQSKLVNFKRNHTTALKVTSIKLRDDIPLRQFSVRALDRE